MPGEQDEIGGPELIQCYSVASADRCTVHPRHLMVNHGRSEQLFADVFVCACGKRATSNSDESKARVPSRDQP